jgi:hypothetical protein
LIAVVGDDAVGHAKAAHQPLDEVDGYPGRYCTYRFDLCPLGELVNSDVEVAVAPCARGNGPRMYSPPNSKGPSERYGL